MKVRILSNFAGPDGRTGQAGDVLDLEAKEARALIKQGTAEEVEAAAGPPEPGSLTQAGSFGGTAAPLGESGQTPGVAAPAPDPLLPAEAHADGLAVGAEGESAVEPAVNREAIQEAADEAGAHDTAKAAHKGGGKGKVHK